LASGRLAIHAAVGGTGQHTVFSGYPALPFTAKKSRHRFIDTGSANHLGITKFHQHRTFGVFGVVAGNTHGAKLFRAAATGTGHKKSLGLKTGRHCTQSARKMSCRTSLLSTK